MVVVKIKVLKGDRSRLLVVNITEVDHKLNSHINKKTLLWLFLCVLCYLEKSSLLKVSGRSSTVLVSLPVSHITPPTVSYHISLPLVAAAIGFSVVSYY